MRQQTGKRPRQHREYEREERRDQNKRPFAHAQESSNNDGLVVYRILCPDSVIGSVIGKNGNVINAIRQQANAKVKVVDPYPGADKRVILVYCYVKHRDLDADEGDDNEPVCPAQDALLRVHNAIVDALDTLHKNRRDSDKKNTEEANILVPASQAASVIGKSGVVIKYLRSTSKAFIKVSPKDPSDITHSCAMSFDNFVQVNFLASHCLANKCKFPTLNGTNQYDTVSGYWAVLLQVTCLVLNECMHCISLLYNAYLNIFYHGT